MGGFEPGDTGFDSGSNPRGGAAPDHSSGLQILVVRRRRTLLLVEYRRRGLVPPLEPLRPSGLASPQTRAPQPWNVQEALCIQTRRPRLCFCC